MLPLPTSHSFSSWHYMLSAHTFLCFYHKNKKMWKSSSGFTWVYQPLLFKVTGQQGVRLACTLLREAELVKYSPPLWLRHTPFIILSLAMSPSGGERQGEYIRGRFSTLGSATSSSWERHDSLFQRTSDSSSPNDEVIMEEEWWWCGSCPIVTRLQWERDGIHLWPP